ncbi:cytochrome C [Sphingomonas koreensis]|nr:cytochrome C [Sphingomonas koreensis]
MAIGALAFRAGVDYPREQAPPVTVMTSEAFSPPSESAIPAGPGGDAIRRGAQIFTATRVNAGKYVGNGLGCANCHLDAGRRANAAPMWAAWGRYPAYRAKNHRINTMEDRIRDCFNYSMNAPASPSGGPPPRGDDVYRDLEMYFAWLATGAPTGKSLQGAGYIKLATTPLGYDPVRGAQVFASHCAACHGASGQGQTNADGSYAYPPLWGEHSYNWGAGMTNVASAAGFIEANMPYGQGYTLTPQQAWDVAAFVDSHDRPRDPRQTGELAEARTQFHGKGDYYGQVVRGDLLGDGAAAKRINHRRPIRE